MSSMQRTIRRNILRNLASGLFNKPRKKSLIGKLRDKLQHKSKRG